MLGALGVTLLLLSAGCHAGTAAPLVIEFWAMGREGEVVQRLVPAFERRHPGVRVRVQQIPWSAAHEKLLTAYVGGTMPDVFQLGNTWIPELVALDAVVPLDDRLARSTAVRRDDYFSGVLDTNVVAAHTYGVPWYVDTRLLFYRRDLLARAGYAAPPATWDGWLDALQRIEAQQGLGHYAILLPITEWQMPVILALGRGAELLRDHAQYGNFRSAPFRQAFAFYLDLFRRGLAPRAGTAQMANLYQDFGSGYFAAFVSGPWSIGELRERLPAMTERWATAPMPSPHGQPAPGVSLAGGASLAIARGSAHAGAAWQWIEYLSDPAQQVAFYRLTGDLPARRSAWQAAALRNQRETRAFWTQLQHVRATPKIPEWERIASTISSCAEAAIRGTMTPDAALTALDRDVDGILEKRRWLRARRTGRGGPAS